MSVVMKKVKRKKRVMAEEERRQKKRERNRKYAARPDVKAKRKEYYREYNKKRRAAPEYKARAREYHRKNMRKRLQNPMLGPKIREQMRKYIASKQPLCCICLSVRTGAGACKDCFARVQGGDHVSIEAFVRCALEHKFPGAEFCTKTRLGGVDWCVVRCYCPFPASFVNTSF